MKSNQRDPSTPQEPGKKPLTDEEMLDEVLQEVAGLLGGLPILEDSVMRKKQDRFDEQNR